MRLQAFLLVGFLAKCQLTCMFNSGISNLLSQSLKATRVAAGDARSTAAFARDSPGNVPLQRWDQENPALARLGGRGPTRFAAFMQGAPQGNSL